MFTSRAEYRILLRQDNADLRLTAIGHEIGLASDLRLQNMLTKKDSIKRLTTQLHKTKVEPPVVNTLLREFNTSPIQEKISLANLLKRPQIDLTKVKMLGIDAATLLDKFDPEVQEQAEINIKYESYVQREQELVRKLDGLEDYKIKSDFDYDRVKALSIESREKLKRIKPETVGQASRISGVSPADLSVLTIYMGK